MPLNATDREELVQLAARLQAMGVSRFKCGEIELEFGGMRFEHVEGVPLTSNEDDKPPANAYEASLLRMAGATRR